MGTPNTDTVQTYIGQTSSMVGAFTSLGLPSSINPDTTSALGTTGNSIFNTLTCPEGSPCYIEKNDALLRSIFEEKQTKYANAPMELSQAEKNLYIYNRGQPGGDVSYNILITDRFASTAEQFKQNTIDKQQQFMSDLLQDIKQYQSALIFKKQMDNLLKLRQREQTDLLKNVNYYQKILQTSERKVVYENKNMDSLYIYRRIMIFLYYAGLVCFIIFGNFIPDKLYTKGSVWLIIIIVAIIPIIMNMVIIWIFFIYDTVSYWFSELPYKDVYKNMGNPADEPPPRG